MQTATNPQTGEKIQWDGTEWKSVGGQQPSAPGIIYGKPKQPPPQRPADALGDDLSNEGKSLTNQLAGLTIEEKREKLAAGKAEREKVGTATAATIQALTSTIDRLNKLEADAKDNSGWFETGTTGRLARSLPFSGAASDLKSSVVGLKAKNAFAALQELAAQGVKLTPISNVEIDLAANSIANLDPDQTQETFLEALSETKRFHQDALDRLQPTKQAPAGQDGGAAPPSGIVDKSTAIPPSPDPQTAETRVGPVGSFVSEADKAFHAKLQGAFKQGANKQELMQLLQDGDYQDAYNLVNLDDAIAYRDGTGKYAKQGPQPGAGFAPPETGQQTGTEQLISTVADGPVGAYGVGAANALTMGGLDEVAGFIGGDDAGERAQFAKDYLRETQPVASLGGEIAGAVIGFKGLGRVAPSLQAASTTRTGSTLAGATYGGLDTNDNRIIGALGGGTVARYAPNAINALGKLAEPALAPVKKTISAFGQKLPGAQTKTVALREVLDNADVVRAGQAENIPVRQPDVRPSLRDQYGGVEATKSGGPAIQQALREDREVIAARLGEVGGDGTPKVGYNLGSGIQDSVGAEKDRLSREAGALYRRVDMQAPGFSAPATRTAKVIDDKIAAIKAVTPEGNTAQEGILNTLKSNLSKTGLSVETLQANRDLVRQKMKQDNLSFTKQETELLEVLDAAAEELASSFAAADKLPALQTLNNANAKWREYSDFKKTIVKELVGNNQREVPAETAARRVLSMVSSGGDSEKFARVFKLLPDAEKADLRALIAENLGKDTKGEFSLAFLAKNLDEKKTNMRTLKSVFGPEGYQSLMNLKALARAKTAATAGFNRSNTTRASNNSGDGFKGFVRGALGFSVGDATGAAAAVGLPAIVEKIGTKRATKMLLDTDFSKWLRNMPETTSPQRIDSYLGKLDKLYPQGSVMASNILVFKDALRAAAESPGRAAAQDEADSRGKPPAQ